MPGLPSAAMSVQSSATAAPLPPLPGGAPLREEEVARLAEAFRIFNQASEELAEAYSALQGQVQQLTAELAEANGELRRQYEEKARLTEQLTTLLNELPAGVVVVDRDGTVIRANPAARQLLGEAEGATWNELATRLVPTEAADECTLEADANPRRLAVNQAQLASGDGRLVLMHDITQAHALKTQAARNERLAAMGELAAGLAHQLRTPLAAALLYVGNLTHAAAMPDEDRQRIAVRAVERLKALERLIRDTLLFARGESLGRERIEVGALLEEVAATIEALARVRGVRFCYLPPRAGAALVGDRKALAGAITNLLENGLQAVDAGGEVRLAADCDGQAWHILVTDSGRGIDPKLQERLFEPFFTTRSDGTGLGLAIARGVARAHGGDVAVSSAPGAGTCFRLTLPFATQETTA